MSNARITFEVEGVKHSLYFGMVATQIISEKSLKAAAAEEKDDIKAFAYIIFGGLSNAADLKDDDRPDFEDAYMLAEAISGDPDISSKIYECWTESKPHKDLMDRLNEIKKKAEAKPKSKKLIGQK